MSFKDFIAIVSCGAAVLAAGASYFQKEAAEKQTAIAIGAAESAVQQAEAAKAQVALSEKNVQTTREQVDIAKAQLAILRAEKETRQQSAGFHAFALESGNLRLISYNTGPQFAIQHITLLPTVVHSGSASPRLGIPVEAKFEPVSSRSGTVAYVIKDYVKQICLWQKFDDECTNGTIADVDLRLSLSGFERVIHLSGRIEVN